MSLHQKDWLKLLGGAALLATGAGAAGIGPLAGLLGGEAAGAGGLATVAPELAGGVMAPEAMTAATAAKGGLDFSGLLAAGAKGAAGSAAGAGAAQLMTPDQKVTRTGQLSFQPPPAPEFPTMQPTTYEEQLRQLGFA